MGVRDVEANKVEGAYRESFKKVLSSEEYSQLEPQIKEFLSYFKPNVRKGDE